MLLMMPYRHGADDGVEMRYALRSIEQNLHPRDGSELELAIVGDLPSWCRPDLYFPWDNPYPYPALNTQHGVLKMVRELFAGGYGEAVYLNDDFFLLFPQDTVLPMHGGKLLDQARSVYRSHAPDYHYTRTMRATVDLLGADVLTYETHMPVPFDLAKLAQTLEDLDGIVPPGVLWKTVYGAKHIEQSYFARSGRVHMIHGFEPGVPWVSSEDSAWARKFGRKLASMFTVPSSWEAS